MAKSRKKNLSTNKTTLFAWPRVLLIIIPLFSAVLILFSSSNGRAVLGVSDTNLLNLHKTTENHDQKISNDSQHINSTCKRNRVTAFSVTTLCDSNKNGFKQFSYTCEDGVTATITKNCVNPQSAFEAAMKACSRTSECAKNEASHKLTPKPTRSESTPEPTGL